MRMTLPLMALIVLLHGCATTPSMNLEIAEELDSYARLLQENGDTDRAREITANAETMARAGREAPRSPKGVRRGTALRLVLLSGFVPADILRLYAADLRAAGRTAEAQEAEALATRYEEEQIATIQRQLGRR
jgi:hypothetical protein